MTNKDTGAAVEDARRAVWNAIQTMTLHRHDEGVVSCVRRGSCPVVDAYNDALDAYAAAIRADEREKIACAAESMASFDGNAVLGASEIRGLHDH